jgi:hypothetical protein
VALGGCGDEAGAQAEEGRTTGVDFEHKDYANTILIMKKD